MIIGTLIILMSYLCCYGIREYIHTMTDFIKIYHFQFTPFVIFYNGDFYLAVAFIYILLVGIMDARGIRYVKKNEIVDILREED